MSQLCGVLVQLYQVLMVFSQTTTLRYGLIQKVCPKRSKIWQIRAHRGHTFRIAVTKVSVVYRTRYIARFPFGMRCIVTENIVDGFPVKPIAFGHNFHIFCVMMVDVGVDVGFENLKKVLRSMYSLCRFESFQNRLH